MKSVTNKFIPSLNVLGSGEASYPTEELTWLAKFGTLCGRPRSSVHAAEGKR